MTFYSTKISIEDLSVSIILTQRVVKTMNFVVTPPHFHADYEVHYILSGEYCFKLENEVLDVKENTLILISPHVHHCILPKNMDGKNQIVSFQFTLSKTSSCNTLYEKYQYILQSVTTYKCWSWKNNTFSMLHQAFYSDSTIEAKYKTDSIFTLIFIDLMQMLRQEINIPSLAVSFDGDNMSIRFEEIRYYIATHYTTSISISDAAASCNLTLKQIERLIRRKMNCSFTEFVNAFRIKKAEQLLHEHSQHNELENTLAHISAMVGYRHYNYFYTQFRKYTGMTPSQYLRTVQKTAE